MKKTKLTTSLLVLLAGAMMLPSCGSNQEEKSEIENYYVINVNDIRTEMLVNTQVVLNPAFTNLGEVANPKYSVKITLEGQDVTATCYNAETKVFAPTVIGTYNVLFTVLTDAGEPYTTKEGSTFTKNVLIDVVTQSFAPRDQAGSDINVSNDGVLTFGETYASKGSKITSNQYKVTGVTFDGSYSITYELNNIHVDPNYDDPALYFGWIKDWKENNDDSIKLSTKNGSMAAWIWGKNGDLADLSSNRAQGWSKGGWWDAPGSTTGGSAFDTGTHTITFERFLNEEKETCVYGIQVDGQPFTYLNVGNAYSKVLTNVWVESNNTAGSIKVKNYKSISDTVAPEIALNFGGEYYIGDSIILKNSCTITDDSVYGTKLVPSFKVFDSTGDEVALVNGVFTPEAAGEYRVVATAKDLMMNEATKEATLTVGAVNPNLTQIDLSETSSTTMDDVGIILYASATKQGSPVEITGFTAKDSNGTDVTSTVIRKYESKDKSMSYDYFQAAEEGVYKVTAVTADGTTREKEISVAAVNTSVYGWTAYDLSTLIYKDKLIIGKDGTIIYKNNGATDGQTIKLGKGVSQIDEWTVEYNVTDLYFTAQGKFFMTKNTLKSDGTSVGWEDLTIGGSCNAQGEPDLWGYECDVVGTGWVSYEWRSVWQDPTTEFMPDPDDHSKGCGREGHNYAQYAVGTHAYKIHAELDTETQKVTYYYYIDGELEVVHHTAEAHDGAAGLDFYQFSGHHFNGIVTGLKVY